MYRLKKEYRGKFIAVANPQILLSDQFVSDGANAEFISNNADRLAKYIETKEGKSVAEVVEESPKVEEPKEAPKTTTTKKKKASKE